MDNSIERGGQTYSNGRYYLSDQAAYNLKHYRYAGGDYGIVYKYFFNPLALMLVDLIPETLAPNVVILLVSLTISF